MKRTRRKKTGLDAIRMLVLDVDGVLTDGTIVVDAVGKEGVGQQLQVGGLLLRVVIGGPAVETSEGFGRHNPLPGQSGRGRHDVCIRGFIQ